MTRSENADGALSRALVHSFAFIYLHIYKNKNKNQSF